MENETYAPYKSDWLTTDRIDFPILICYNVKGLNLKQKIPVFFFFTVITQRNSMNLIYCYKLTNFFTVIDQLKNLLACWR